MRNVKLGRLGCLSLVMIMGLVAAACSSNSPSSSGTTTTTASGPANLSASSFTSDYSAAMGKLKSLAASGRGKIATILPDTVSSTRYVEFDQPDITKALQAAGLTTSQYIPVQNALGSDATQLTDAQTDITNGATVLLVDPIDSGVGAEIESYAKSHGVDVIDYDRLTLGGSREYYVSFNNVEVGTLLGQGLASCIAAWKVAKPEVVVMHGAATDNNATLFAQGYDAVLKTYFNSGKWTDVVNTAGTWDPPTAETEFQEAYTAHPDINAALIPNDETGAPIVTYLQTLHIKAKSFPLTGQDATLTGLQNVLAGYQCGTVYKPYDVEAQASVALAIYLRAGKKPPSALVNGTTEDTTSNTAVATVVLKPEWVTTANMNATVIQDGAIPASQLCAGSYASPCTAAGITS